jgi:hypothetical protein
MLAGISSASIQGRIALGPRAGARVWRVGEEPDAPWVLSSSPRHAHIAGFDLHANIAVPAADRARLEQLCRYLLRPPAAQERLRRMGDDRILLTLKTAWADGTRHLIFAPMELLEKLAALTPRPRINLILYHGVLAPDARWRARVVAFGALPGTAATAPNLERVMRSMTRRHRRRRVTGCGRTSCAEPSTSTCSPARSVGGVSACSAPSEDPVAIRAILDSLAVSDALSGSARPRPPRWSPQPSRRRSDRPGRLRRRLFAEATAGVARIRGVSLACSNRSPSLDRPLVRAVRRGQG